MSKLTRELDSRDTAVRPIENWAPPQLLPQPDERQVGYIGMCEHLLWGQLTQ